MAALPLAPARAQEWHDVDVTGSSPSLALRLQATPDGRTVTQDDYRGGVTMLYFGYTFCPDVCPLTLQNVLTALNKTGEAVRQIRFLFVTVDPRRDTIPVLAGYMKAFGPEFVGLRGDADALERLTTRFRIAWSVSPSDDPRQYDVTHSAAIYVFDRQLNARFLVPSMASQTPDIDGLAADLVRLSNEKPSWFSWLRGQV
jgi:protein SCO1/2